MRLTRRTMIIVGTLTVGILVGAVADRTYWFGLRRRNVTAADCEGMSVISPYTAWWMTISRDGSASLAQGRSVGTGGFGFSTLLTMGLTNPGDRCQLPAGAFDFPKISRELISARRPATYSIADYEEMPYQVIFRLSPAAAAERADPVAQSRILFDTTDGSIDHAIGARLVEEFRKAAQDRGVWPVPFEAAWPYPPIPWNSNLGVPGKLKVSMQN